MITQERVLADVMAEHDNLVKTGYDPLLVRALLTKAVARGVAAGRVDGAARMRQEIGYRSQDVLADFTAMADKPK